MSDGILDDGSAEAGGPDGPTEQMPQMTGGQTEQAPQSSSCPTEQMPRSAGNVASGARRFGISSFTLKIIAIIGMTAEHTAAVMGASLPFALTCTLDALGGLTFPIMAFLINEGYSHTHDIRKYAWRLGIFAIISQVPYGIFFAVDESLYGCCDVLFTLLLGLGLIYAYDHLKDRSAFWLVFCLGVAISYFFDWGIIGPMMIMLFHTTQGRTQRTLVPTLLPAAGIGIPALVTTVVGSIEALPTALYALLGCPLSGVLLLAYDGRRGRPLKWFFYVYYPLHILVIGLIAKALGIA